MTETTETRPEKRRPRIWLPSLRCPSCGYHAILTDGTHLLCDGETCSRRDAAEVILRDHVPYHVIDLQQDGYVLEHPLVERLDGKLYACDLHMRMWDHAPPALETGYRYKILVEGNALRWEQLP